MFEELAAYEAAIRADEREKCAREVEVMTHPDGGPYTNPANIVARLRAGAYPVDWRAAAECAIRAARGERDHRPFTTYPDLDGNPWVGVLRGEQEDGA